MYKIAAAALGILLTAAVLYAVGYRHAGAKCESEWLAAQNAILEKQTAMQKEYERALNESRKKQSAILADFSAANSELGGLRDAVNAGGLSNAACADDNGAAVSKLFIECAGEYIQMAKNADQHASDALTCVSAWRAVENVK
jgi:hypothetical protein